MQIWGSFRDHDLCSAKADSDVGETELKVTDCAEAYSQKTKLLSPEETTEIIVPQHISE